jgi:hypothetical protein
MPDIYDQHRAAFPTVSAYVVTDAAGSRVGTVALRFPKDGAGRLWAYVHVLGVPMVRGYADGGGYDKRSAAVESAARKIAEYDDPERVHAPAWRTALRDCGGDDWSRALERAGYRVLQAV